MVLWPVRWVPWTTAVDVTTCDGCACGRVDVSRHAGRKIEEEKAEGKDDGASCCCLRVYLRAQLACVCAAFVCCCQSSVTRFLCVYTVPRLRRRLRQGRCWSTRRGHLRVGLKHRAVPCCADLSELLGTNPVNALKMCTLCSYSYSQRIVDMPHTSTVADPVLPDKTLVLTPMTGRVGSRTWQPGP